MSEPVPKTFPLPEGITLQDTKRPDYDTPDYADYRRAAEKHDAPKYTTYGGELTFELWYTERFGWVIPTLQIAAVSGRLAARGVQNRRTYAVAVKDKQLVRAGFGPHVLATHTVYVRKSSMKRLEPFLELMLLGQAKAGDCRDRISTRRAQTAMRRDSMGWL